MRDELKGEVHINALECRIRMVSLHHQDRSADGRFARDFLLSSSHQLD